MWSDLSNDDLIDAAAWHRRRYEPLPLDLIAELMKRGLTPKTH